MSRLTEDELYEVLRLKFPAQNDFGEQNYTEELQELFDFGIESKEQLLALVDKHIDEVLQIDSAPMEEHEIKYFVELFGELYVNDRVKNKYWYAFAGLLRLILELEFEDDYRDYAEERDHPEED